MGHAGLRRWLASIDADRATDLHLKPGSPPKLREKGELLVLPDEPALTKPQVDELAAEVLTRGAVADLEDRGDGACTHAVDGLGRFRVRALRQRGSTALVIRRIPTQVESLEELGLPPVVADLAGIDRGLVLVAGPPRSGRRRTLASMLDHVNRTKPVHVVGIGRPVEILHRDEVASVSQLEVGDDTPSFADGVRAGVAADGDVIVVSDLEDAATAAAILDALEDGAAVLAGVDAVDGAEAVARLGDPALERHLVATVAQRLAPRRGGGKVAVVEVTVTGDPSRDRTFADSIAERFEAGEVDLRGALEVADDWPALRGRLGSREPSWDRDRDQDGLED
jgi:twitching motility protein PilT